MQTISSQRHLDDSIVSEKLSAEDFQVFVSPEFEVDGETYRVVLDGHHSLAAAKRAGVDAEFIVMDQQQHDAIALLYDGDIDTFLESTHLGDDYYDVNTGRDVW